jgi:hypothetical protein
MPAANREGWMKVRTWRSCADAGLVQCRVTAFGGRRSIRDARRLYLCTSCEAHRVMHVEWHEGGRLVVRFEEAGALDALLERARSTSPILRLETRLDEGAPVVLVLSDQSRNLELTARVKQVFRSGMDLFGTMLEIDLDSGREAVAVEGEEAPEEVSAAVSDTPCEPDAFDDSDAAEAPEESETGPALAGETLGTSVTFDLQRMRPDEKVRLATKANRVQRQVLLRDRTPQVLLALLNNPWLENAEVLEMAKNPKVVGPVLQRIADDRRFGPNAQVQSALARNPSTPWTVTTRLLPLLHTRELRELARSQHVREAVRKAALKIYLGRL